MKKANEKARRQRKKWEKFREERLKNYTPPTPLFRRMTFDEDIKPLMLLEGIKFIPPRFKVTWVRFLLGSVYLLLHSRPFKVAQIFLLPRSRMWLFRRPFLRWNPLLYYYFCIVYLFNLKFLYNTTLLLVDLRYFIYSYFFADTNNRLEIHHFLKRRIVKLVRFSNSHMPFQLSLFFLLRTYVRFLHVFKHNQQLFNNPAKHTAYNDLCASPYGIEGASGPGAVWSNQSGFHTSIMFRNINFYLLWDAEYESFEYHNASFHDYTLNHLNYMTFYHEFYKTTLFRRRVYQALWGQISRFFPYSLYLVMNEYKDFNYRWRRSMTTLKHLHYSRLALHYSYFSAEFVEDMLLKHNRTTMFSEYQNSPKTNFFLAFQAFSLINAKSYYIRCPDVIVYCYVAGFVDYIDKYFFHDFAPLIYESLSRSLKAYHRYLFLDIIQLLLADGGDDQEKLIRSHDWNIHDIFASLEVNSELSDFPALIFPEEHWMLNSFRTARSLDIDHEYQFFNYTLHNKYELRYYSTFMFLLQDLILNIFYWKPFRLGNAEIYDLKLILYRHFRFHFTKVSHDNTFNHFIKNHTWHFFVP